MNINAKGIALALCVLMLLPLAVNVQAEAQPIAPSITTAWTDDGASGIRHAYTLTFADEEAYELNISLDHQRSGEVLAYETFVTWSVEDNLRVADIEFNTTLEWGDEIEVSALVTSMNGQALENDLRSTRSLTVGTWNQPMADHEVMTSTTWNLNQTYQDENGNQTFVLSFVGQGWQERIGTTLNSWELGNGSLLSSEVTNESETTLNLVLDSIWKNETIESGSLTSQVFDARGYGTLVLMTDDGDATTMIVANVSDGRFNRTMIGSNISEPVSYTHLTLPTILLV